MADQSRRAEIERELWNAWIASDSADKDDVVRAAAGRIAELESAVRTYLAAVDEESGQAIALEALRKALGGHDA